MRRPHWHLMAVEHQEELFFVYDTYSTRRQAMAANVPDELFEIMRCTYAHLSEEEMESVLADQGERRYRKTCTLRTTLAPATG